MLETGDPFQYLNIHDHRTDEHAPLSSVRAMTEHLFHFYNPCRTLLVHSLVLAGQCEGPTQYESEGTGKWPTVLLSHFD